MKKVISAILIFLKDRFNFSHEQEDNFETIRSIEKGVEFRGVNVWTLIFAIFVASIGLNVNSTAVIIGAMLISPLMGPIMGLGLSVGINDFSLMKKSFKNLSIAVVISVLTSAVYFFISPLNGAQSELLARTTPTIYDVLIALFGGLAGIVTSSSKEKGTVMPGVAIATALMPPLCTAGYGLATANIYYFLGAFYLFFINAVMISLATFLIVRFLKFPLKRQVDKMQTNKVKRYIYLIVIITVLPSIYFAYQIVQETIFKTNAHNFINKELVSDHIQILSKKYIYSRHDSCRIEVLLMGAEITPSTLKILSKKLPEYSLSRTKLVVKQGLENVVFPDVSQLKVGIIEELYEKNRMVLADKDERIKLLENEITTLKSTQYPVKQIAEEINAINQKVISFGVSRINRYDLTLQKPDTVVAVNLKLKSRLTASEQAILHKWLVRRLNNNNVCVLTE